MDTVTKPLFKYLIYIILLNFIISPALPTKADTTDDHISPTFSVNFVKENESIIKIYGTISDNLTPADQIKMVLDGPDELVDIYPSIDGTWTLDTNLTQDLSLYSIKVSDDSLNTKTIFLNDTRAIISSITVSAYNPNFDGQTPNQVVDLIRSDDMTRVKVDTQFTIEVSNNYFFHFQTHNSPISILDGNSKLDGQISSYYEKNNKLYLIYQLEKSLTPNKTYKIVNNSSDIENNTFQFTKKFTTVSDVVSHVDMNKQKNLSNWDQQPHGYYTYNVNTCATCHSTHTAETKDLQNKNIKQSYCMACHDGTTAPKMDEHKNSMLSKHDTQILTDKNSKSDSCTACHNPHQPWSSENPSLLKGHSVYKNNDQSEIDSLDTTCDSCHKEGAITGPDDYHQHSNYQILSYKKTGNSSGQPENYSLCLRCHNINKSGLTDIKTFYEDKTSLHRITALDGNLLTKSSDLKNDGHLPCAECHETHSSSNKNLLRDNFGHENQTPEPFSIKNENWLIKEKEFCIKCHNGSTSIFGVTGKKYDETIEAHTEYPEKTCSNCHGGTGTDEEKALRAAHDPQTGIVPSP